MPLYEFDCPRCGTVFEKLVWRSDAVSEVECPNCGNPRVEEKVSAFASVTRDGTSPGAGGSSCAPSGG